MRATMCGRYSLAMDVSGLDERFSFRGLDLPYRPRFNIAPTQDVLTVVNDGSENRASVMRWGLIPSWAKDSAIGNRMINARAETIMEKPSFRKAFQKRRCLVIADGFYEWRRIPAGKIPMRIILKTGEPFGFAGLWEKWKSPRGALVHSCTIITTGPNAMMEPIHNRMPVILPSDAEAMWLNTGEQDMGALQDMLVPHGAGEMDAYEVSTLVNKPSNDTPDVIARIG